MRSSKFILALTLSEIWELGCNSRRRSVRGLGNGICYSDPTSFQEEAPPDPGAAGPPGEGGADGEAPPIQYSGSTMACHPWLSSMINYAQPVKFQSFETAESKSRRENLWW